MSSIVILIFCIPAVLAKPCTFSSACLPGSGVLSNEAAALNNEAVALSNQSAVLSNGTAVMSNGSAALSNEGVVMSNGSGAPHLDCSQWW